MYKHIIFDLDGTLLNTIDDLADAGNWVCQNHGWPTHTVDEYRYFVGNGMAKLTERFVPEDWRTPEGVQTILEEFMRYYDAHKADKTAPYPWIPEMLDQLNGAGVSMAVLTNKAHQLAGPVVEQYYPGVFSIVQGALPGYPTKPDPTLLHKLMAEMGATIEDTLFVGDSNVDIRTAKNGGLTSCGVLWGFRSRQELEAEGADFLAQTAQELVEVIFAYEPPVEIGKH